MHDKLTMRADMIADRLRLLAVNDTEYKIFGAKEPWGGHEYKRFEPVMLQDVEGFETSAGFKFPEDYKYFVTQISDGGAGPFYGMYGYHDAIHYALCHILLRNSYEDQTFSDEEICEAFKPFPYNNAETHAFITQSLTYDDDEFQCMPIPQPIPGFIYLCEYGCGGYYILIVNGEQAGTVWFYQSGEYVKPCYVENDNDEFKQWSFFDLYEWWLADSLVRLGLEEPKPTTLNPVAQKYLAYDKQGLTAIPELVFTCKNLRQLFYTRNSLPEVPLSLYELHELRILDLNFNGITFIPPGIHNLKHLKKLNLSYNSTLPSLPDDVCKLSNLKSLILSYCSSLTLLPKDIGMLQNLERLECFASGLTELPDSVTHLTNLHLLTLTSCPLKQLPENFGALKSLATLSVENTQLATLPYSFSNLSALETLNVKTTSLHLEQVISLIKPIASLRTLEIFASMSIPSSIGDLEQLETLSICHNYKLEESCTLPSAIWSLPLKSFRIETGQVVLPKNTEGQVRVQLFSITLKQAEQILNDQISLPGLQTLHVSQQLDDYTIQRLQALLPSTIINS